MHLALDQNKYKATGDFLASQELYRSIVYADQMRGHAFVRFENQCFLVPGFKTASYANAYGVAIERRSAQELLAQSLSRWKLHAYSSNSSDDVDAISETVQYIFETLEQLGAYAIDLSDVREDSIHPEHMAAVLRATYQCKSQVKGWTDALNCAKNAAMATGKNIQDIFFGLDKD